MSYRLLVECDTAQEFKALFQTLVSTPLNLTAPPSQPSIPPAPLPPLSAPEPPPVFKPIQIRLPLENLPPQEDDEEELFLDEILSPQEKKPVTRNYKGRNYLTPKMIRKIKQMSKLGYKNKVIAERLNYAPITITKVLKGQRDYILERAQKLMEKEKIKYLTQTSSSSSVS